MDWKLLSKGDKPFHDFLRSLAPFGRLVIIGFITGYETQAGYVPSRTLSTLPARVSASVFMNFVAAFVRG